MSQNVFINSFFVARQPVFDTKQSIWGYELLFRNSSIAKAAFIDDEDEATSQVIADGFGLIQEDLEEHQKILINFPRNMLLDKASDLLPPETCVIEILETVQPEAEILKALENIHNDGFQLALDDFVGQAGYEPLVAMADIVKVDCLELSDAQLRKVVSALRNSGVKTLLAEKVENQESFSKCLELGFDLFQGFFFSKPEILPGEKLSSTQLIRFELLRTISSPDFDVDDLTAIINSDVSISYRLLKFINSAAYGIPNKVKSIQQAITLLGYRRLSGWLRVIMLSDMSSTPVGYELIFLSLKRAKFFELLARGHKGSPYPPDTMFLLGLFSLLDVLLGKPMKELLEKLPLEEGLAVALYARKGQAASWLNLVESFEKADWSTVISIVKDQKMCSAAIARHHHAAMQWAHEISTINKSKSA